MEKCSYGESQDNYLICGRRGNSSLYTFLLGDLILNGPILSEHTGEPASLNLDVNLHNFLIPNHGA